MSLTSTGADVRQDFLDRLLVAVSDARSRLRIVVTVRADHWHRPLLHPGSGDVRQTEAPGAIAVGVGGDGSIILGGDNAILGSEDRAIAGTEGTASILAGTPPTEVGRISTGLPDPIVAVDLSGDSRPAVTHQQFGNLTLWDVETATPLWSWTPGASDRWDRLAGMIEVGLGTDGTPLVVGLVQLAETSDGEVILGNSVIDEGRVVRTLPGVGVDDRVALMPDGSTMVTLDSTDCRCGRRRGINCSPPGSRATRRRTRR